MRTGHKLTSTPNCGHVSNAFDSIDNLICQEIHRHNLLGILLVFASFFAAHLTCYTAMKKIDGKKYFLFELQSFTAPAGDGFGGI